ncbi:unnamed protein product [Amoebophrya sp. A25]|nr:unnamed protein product [Amoebophrya sp. A25]|eukprot:GSA25T00003784001.1
MEECVDLVVSVPDTETVTELFPRLPDEAQAQAMGINREGLDEQFDSRSRTNPAQFLPDEAGRTRASDYRRARPVIDPAPAYYQGITNNPPPPIIPENRQIRIEGYDDHITLEENDNRNTQQQPENDEVVNTQEEGESPLHHDPGMTVEDNKRLDVFERLIANFPDFLAQILAASSNSVVTNRAHTTPTYPHQQRPTEDLVQSGEKKRLLEAHLRSTAALVGDPLTGLPLFENFAFLEEDTTGMFDARAYERDEVEAVRQELEKMTIKKPIKPRSPQRGQGEREGSLEAEMSETRRKEMQDFDVGTDVQQDPVAPGSDSSSEAASSIHVFEPPLSGAAASSGADSKLWTFKESASRLTHEETSVKKARRHFLAVREIFVRVLAYLAQVAGERWQIVTHKKNPTGQEKGTKSAEGLNNEERAQVLTELERLGVMPVQLVRPRGGATTLENTRRAVDQGEDVTTRNLLLVRGDAMFRHDKITSPRIPAARRGGGGDEGDPVDAVDGNDETFWHEELGSIAAEDIHEMFNAFA